MTDPAPGTPAPRNARRERLVGLFVLGVALVLLVSTPTWFASDQSGVAIAQLAVAVVLAAAGAWLVRRAGRG
ncbi:hypothetical protein E9549_05085 [Blastococcus sp. MG754426]|uniref:hypothetical protein n=1 Tax=unclassified Blastococcus TaxID=2619396 RepID=UPI001EF02200|nr:MULTISPECIES: hypothetical protein [unclassified Blastococcus]MCF6506781.1 hypothetical protein [Blastococcus sp. MG754426]MCF6511352.1 hypothetical protein [Blastococcus sp. MG754427]MCF6734807.1 hypothetical protein [Blastococcus sp. KM273129]